MKKLNEFVIEQILTNKRRDVLELFDLKKGKVYGHEFVCLNPCREDKNAGSFKFNLKTGYFADFACEGVKGNGLIEYLAYVNQAHKRDVARYLRDYIKKDGCVNAAKYPRLNLLKLQS